MTVGAFASAGLFALIFDGLRRQDIAAPEAPPAPRAPLRGALVLGAATAEALRARLEAVQAAAASGTAPPPAPPHVAFDFWEQVRQADELDEIRAYRPAAYQALPKEPGAR